MIKLSATISLVSALRGGPWIYWDDLAESCQKAGALGFDGVELFTATSTEIEEAAFNDLLAANNLTCSAVGTGAGKVLNGWTLTNADSANRAQAVDFIKGMIDFGARHGAPAIIGSMQGNVEKGEAREAVLDRLAAGLNQLGQHAADQGVPLIYEPLNRYETNLFNTMASGVEFLGRLDTKNVVLLADLFHMNIEEASIGDAIRAAGSHIGHFHLADSNRRPAGFGHTDMGEAAQALKDIGYTKYASAEAFAWPDPDGAAEQTMKAFNAHFA
ncbi:MAG: sugar phosphate isomerase/epimerase [Kiritimatiellia bacterium]|jgi:sugar phosphate isomerase/epimerase